MNTERVAELNDKLRDTILSSESVLKEIGEFFGCSIDCGIKDHIVMTSGINALTQQQQLHILDKVKNFKDFNKGDNPRGDDTYGERDFGAFKNEEDIKIFWKIDYYDNDLKYHSEDKSDPDKTTRVLTIMLASEY
jgi:hypothetical protein